MVERAYDLQPDLDGWLHGVAEAARPLLDCGLGLLVWTFDGQDPERPALSPAACIGGAQVFDHAPLLYLEALGLDVGRAAYTSAPPICTASEVSRILGVRWASWMRHAPPGCRDCLAVAGIGPDQQGVIICVPLPERRQVTAAQRRLWSVVAAHLLAGFQLRRGAGERGSMPLPLTKRESEVSAGVAVGHQLKRIAYDLGLSPKTVSFHLGNALAKLERRPDAATAAP